MEALIDAFGFVFGWPTVGWIFLAVVAGLVIGIIPGLGGVAGLTILLPLTYAIDFRLGLVVMVSLLAAVVTSDSIASILLGVPGTSGAQATLLDGRAMTRNGEAPRALGAAYAASLLGALVGAAVLALSVPIVRPMVLNFGPPELLVLGVWGVSLVGTLSAGATGKGLSVACLGLLFSTVGRGPMGADLRFTFGQVWLWDGLPLIALALGIFAIPEFVEMLGRYKATQQRLLPPLPTLGTTGLRNVLVGVGDAIRNWWLIVRSGLIGAWVGFIPGVGASVADWFAYSIARQTSRNNQNFGRGDVRGVIAPEASVNAARGGDLIPMLAFGVPGSAPTAIVLGAFLMAGVNPGRSMLTTHLHITYSLVWALAIANLMATMICLFMGRTLARLPYMPGTLLTALVIPIIVTASYAGTADPRHFVVFLGAGVLGIGMKRFGWPRPPLLLAFVLGPIIERNVGLTLQLFGWSALQRPGTLIFLGLMTATLAYLAFVQHKDRRITDLRMKDPSGLVGR